MISIWDITKTALTPVGLPLAAGQYVLATSVSTDLPNEFLVYTLVSSPPEQHADNAETMRSYNIQVNHYSRTGITAAVLASIINAMIAAGFVRGPVRDIPYNQDTRHFGQVLEFVFLEGE